MQRIGVVDPPASQSKLSLSMIKRRCEVAVELGDLAGGIGELHIPPVLSRRDAFGTLGRSYGRAVKYRLTA
jgi:hypothetical protein